MGTFSSIEKKGLKFNIKLPPLFFRISKRTTCKNHAKKKKHEC